jgi:hypothetical protein
MAFQFDRPAVSSGVVLVFRRPDAAAATMRFTLHGLDAGRHYRIENFDLSGTELLSGRSLMQQGLEFSLDAPASAIVRYERQSGGSA